MSSVDGIMRQLEALGSEQTRKTFARHGIDADTFGVKVGDLKKVAKTIKGEQALAMELFASGTYDAMYLAGMVADGGPMRISTSRGFRTCWTRCRKRFTPLQIGCGM